MMNSFAVIAACLLSNYFIENRSRYKQGPEKHFDNLFKQEERSFFAVNIVTAKPLPMLKADRFEDSAHYSNVG